jgi:hypothetical protein
MPIWAALGIQLHLRRSMPVISNYGINECIVLEHGYANLVNG